VVTCAFGGVVQGRRRAVSEQLFDAWLSLSPVATRLPSVQPVHLSAQLEVRADSRHQFGFSSNAEKRL
jgi:hypothetical protein